MKNISSGIKVLLDHNKSWASQMTHEEPDFFSKLVKIQAPKYLWIGCADSRVPANEIVGLKPGEMFVHRNIANVVSPADVNVLAVIQYAIYKLKVEHILVTGHYGCGGIRASLERTDYGHLEAWLSHVREVRAQNDKKLDTSDDVKMDESVDKLVEYNVMAQVLNVGRIPFVQKILTDQSQPLAIHGLVYDLHDGILKDLNCSISKLNDIPEKYRVV